ncbi:MAG: hypothetical protein GC158_09730 [Cyanobacteria bacterium RI_101]|nr:hypothetical protein [Cyanobacteria bacterium RI_101]
MLIQKIIDELQEIPEEKLDLLYALILDFRSNLHQESLQPRRPGLLQGELGGAFFEPLPEEELDLWETNT